MINTFGYQSELLVARHLSDQGFTILEQNYKKFFGEIDIIAQKKDLIIFVEVKARKNSQISMHELIRPSKQQKIIKVAQSYMGQHNIYEKMCRFDVALLHIVDNKESMLTYIPNAFCQGEY
ncbi:MAG TPA: YraN family protein [Candidatus Saccharimonadales bacterium]|nr:YraN family protein [Candidatus Saccharimonadales bacterium]